MKCLIVYLCVVLIMVTIECRLNTSTEDSEESLEYYKTKANNLEWRARAGVNKMDDDNFIDEIQPTLQNAAFVVDDCVAGKTRIRDECVDID